MSRETQRAENVPNCGMQKEKTSWLSKRAKTFQVIINVTEGSDKKDICHVSLNLAQQHRLVNFSFATSFMMQTHIKHDSSFQYTHCQSIFVLIKTVAWLWRQDTSKKPEFLTISVFEFVWYLHILANWTTTWNLAICYVVTMYIYFI